MIIIRYAHDMSDIKLTGGLAEKSNSSLDNQAGTRNEAQILQRLAKELRVKHLPGKGLGKALHFNVILLAKSGSNFEQRRGDGEGFHDVPIGRLESHAGFCIGRGRF